MKLRNLRFFHFLAWGLMICALTGPAAGQVQYQPVLDFPNPKKYSEGIYFNTENFRTALGDAMTNAQGHRHALRLTDGWLYPVDGWAEVDGDGTSGSWRVRLSTHTNQKWFSDKVQVYRGIAIIDNFHRELRVICATVQVSDRFLPTVEAALAEERQKLASKYSDIQIEQGVYEGRPSFVATYSYAGGIKTRDLEKRLEHLIRGGLKLLDIVTQTRGQALKEVHDGLRDGTPSMLSKDDFMILLDPTLVDLEAKKEKEGVTHGYWDYDMGDDGEIWCETLNYGNRIDLTVWEPLYVNNPPALNEQIFATLQTRVAEKPLEGADQMVVEWYTDTTNVNPGEKVVWVKSQINVNGTKKGKEIQEIYKRFDTKYVYDLYKLITDVQNESSEAYAKDLNARPLNALTREEFLIICDDDLDEVEAEKEGVSEGYWEFNADDPTRLFEIYNYKDRMELTMLVESSEDMPEKEREKVLKMTQKKYAKTKPTPEASNVEILLYPGYEHYIWLKVTYPYDGSMAVEKLAQAYTTFTTDYTKKVAKDIHKWLK